MHLQIVIRTEKLYCFSRGKVSVQGTTNVQVQIHTDTRTIGTEDEQEWEYKTRSRQCPVGGSSVRGCAPLGGKHRRGRSGFNHSVGNSEPGLL